VTGLVIDEAEDRVAPDRVAAAERFRPDGVDMHLALAADQRDDAWHFTVLDVGGHDVAQAAEPRLG